MLDIVRKKERKEREKGKECWGGKGGEWVRESKKMNQSHVHMR